LLSSSNSVLSLSNSVTFNPSVILQNSGLELLACSAERDNTFYYPVLDYGSTHAETLDISKRFDHYTDSLYIYLQPCFTTTHHNIIIHTDLIRKIFYKLVNKYKVPSINLKPVVNGRALRIISSGCFL